MSHRTLLLALAATAILSLAPTTVLPGPPAETESTPTPSPVPAERVARIARGLVSPLQIAGEPVVRQSLEKMKHDSGVPAVALAIVDDCAVAWAGGWGALEDGESPVTGATPFQAGSVSKAVTATVAMSMVAAGELDLEAPVNSLLASWKLPENDLTRRTPVLVRHLLTNSAGLTRTAYWFERSEPLPPLPAILRGEGTNPSIVVERAPGDRAVPSNSGFLVLQHVLEEVGGAPLAQLARQRLFSPAGMTSSAFEPVDEQLLGRAARGHQRDGTEVAPLVPAAPGGLWASAEDLGRLMAALMSSWQGRPGALLPRDVARSMLTVQVGDMGLGLHLRGRGEALSFQQAGGGIGSQARLVAYPQLCQGAAVVINSDRGRRLVAETLAAVGQEYGWPDLPLEVAEVDLPAASLERFAGRYEYDASPGAVMTFTVEGDSLFARAGDREPFPVLAVEETLFVTPRAASEIRFHVSADGTADGATIGTAGFYGTHLTRLD